MKVLQRIGLKYKTSLDLRSGFLIKSLLSSQKLGCNRVYNPKFKKGKSTNSPNEKPTCAKCEKSHLCECLVGTGNCFSCGKSDHKMRVFPNLKSQDKGNGQAQASGSTDTQKKNRFHALLYTGEQETSPNVIIGMLFSLDVYDLLDPSLLYHLLHL